MAADTKSGLMLKQIVCLIFSANASNPVTHTRLRQRLTLEATLGIHNHHSKATPDIPRTDDLAEDGL
ncbi:unnamed protein product [Leptosia nina]|uniref:Uncharacterized protein n=1 Tax=Leptosia nina TaxID=320188 RepID=A0AAV1J4Q7_9NEOP